MRDVEFRIEPEELGAGIEDVVSIYVDGVHLQQLARDAELPSARAEGNPDLAGIYAGLQIVWPSRHFLGEPRLSRSGRTFLLGCVCGWAECWPLAARVEVTGDSVTWQTGGAAAGTGT